MADYIEIDFPSTVPITAEQFEKIKVLNPLIRIEQVENRLRINEGELTFFDSDFFDLHIPFEIQEEYYRELCELNDYKIECNPTNLIISMGTTELISAFTVLITVTIAIWNRTVKLGKTYDAQVDNKLDSQIEKHRIPDVAFITFKKFVDSIKLKNGFIIGSPTLCIEVVSNKKSLNENIRKMQNDWMPAGTEIGLVVCPVRKKYYLFEQGIEDFQTIDFTIPFQHESLSGLEINFEELLNEAIENCG
jgi:Uma2 family endonuclease